MKEISDKKMYYFVDESGDTNFYGKNGIDLIKHNKASKIFIVGYLETENMNQISKDIYNLKTEIKNDQYLKGIPSLEKSLLHFHAKDDCSEVRQLVFKSIAKMDFNAYILVFRKNAEHFKKKFNCEPSKLYEYMIEKLFENRLHLYKDIDLYFSKMGNIIREHNMKNALEKAKFNFKNKWNNKESSNIRIFIQEPSQIMPLQVIDYVIWTINRVYEKNDLRYYNFIKNKIKLIYDIMDTKKYPHNYYSEKNPLDINKISPLDS
ncbi:MAG: hypothetical protein A2086_14660 [Spirochaetes bacterium GWD1_27_9]|nr:MAG: hypothetical protein A2Z98_04740 [Spirochaetes bacterium GWB1_27_13]OHD24947.1 MAG: hypothetical protein A2Y34_06205 [Spirochaetes bacterium GWC1_27_15]OHD38549.1 MAG: hypothetical protein A2086_14660 [Spirochaetes bacterium GWD1_27_9]